MNDRAAAATPVKNASFMISLRLLDAPEAPPGAKENRMSRCDVPAAYWALLGRLVVRRFRLESAGSCPTQNAGTCGRRFKNSVGFGFRRGTAGCAWCAGLRGRAGQ